ncbi:MAG TPA: helix-turn-helix domain-containing protein, partial [Dokdonella sp.]|uniref:helix-turn-helix domain-containing protein n=1 Tax=Dokdonella sp. TaxID=2291710 RepID=UPI002C243E1D
MARQYQHLSGEERAVIQIERRNGSSLRAIARGLDRDVSTVSRELARNEVEMEPGKRVRYEA